MLLICLLYFFSSSPLPSPFLSSILITFLGGITPLASRDPRLSVPCTPPPMRYWPELTGCKVHNTQLGFYRCGVPYICLAAWRQRGLVVAANTNTVGWLSVTDVNHYQSRFWSKGIAVWVSTMIVFSFFVFRFSTIEKEHCESFLLFDLESWEWKKDKLFSASLVSF